MALKLVEQNQEWLCCDDKDHEEIYTK